MDDRLHELLELPLFQVGSFHDGASAARRGRGGRAAVEASSLMVIRPGLG